MTAIKSAAKFLLNTAALGLGLIVLGGFLLL